MKATSQLSKTTINGQVYEVSVDLAHVPPSRRKGHSALRVNNGKLEKFDPHPEEPPIKPLHDRVLIRRIPDAEPLLAVPQVAQRGIGEGESRQMKGVIVAVGPGKNDEDGDFCPTTVKPGQTVYFNGRWNDWKDAPKGMALIQEGDIMGYAE